MEITISEIQIIPIKPENGLIAFTSFVLDANLYLGSIGILTKPEGGYRLVYPTKKIGDRSINIYHPINRQFAELLENQIIEKLEEVMNKSNDRHCGINIRPR